MKRNPILTVTLAVALGLEIITPGGERRPHTETEIILAPETTGTEADALRPFVTPPENPWRSDFTLRVTSPEELKDWWVNTHSNRSGGLVTVMRTQTCGEARFKEKAFLHNPNTNQDIETVVYLNEDYVISWRTRKLCEQLQQWLLQKGVATQVLLRVDNVENAAGDPSLASNYAPVYDDCDGVTEIT